MKRVLEFLGLIDENGQLSRTNVAVYIAIAGMVQSLVRHSTIDYGPLAAFIVALVSYQAKRWMVQQDVASQVQDTLDEHAAALDAHKAEVKANISQVIAAQNVTTAKVQSIVNALKNRSGVTL